MAARCTGFNYKMEVCNRHCDAEQAFCKNHLYMEEYTEEMIRAMILCKGCKKVKFIADGKLNCEICANRSKMNRIINAVEVVFCAQPNCKNKRSEENKYCGKHQASFFMDETTEKNMKVCRNYVRGCRSQLSMDYSCIRCPACLQKERELDHMKRHGAKQSRENEDLNGADHRSCTICSKSFPLSHFVGESGITLACQDCRERNYAQDRKRDTNHRNELARENLKRKKTNETISSI